VPLMTRPIGDHSGGLADWAEVFRYVQGHEAWAVHRDWIEAVEPTMGPDVGERFCFAASVTDAEYRRMAAERERVSDYLTDTLGDETLLVLPAAVDIAPRRDASADALQAFRVGCMRLTSIAGVARLPQVVMPWQRIAGCPFGVSLVGARGTDRALLARLRDLPAATAVAAPETPAVDG